MFSDKALGCGLSEGGGGLLIHSNAPSKSKLLSACGLRPWVSKRSLGEGGGCIAFSTHSVQWRSCVHVFVCVATPSFATTALLAALCAVCRARALLGCWRLSGPRATGGCGLRAPALSGQHCASGRLRFGFAFKACVLSAVPPCLLAFRPRAYRLTALCVDRMHALRRPSACDTSTATD
jgi:hypothetical protein